MSGYEGKRPTTITSLLPSFPSATTTTNSHLEEHNIPAYTTTSHPPRTAHTRPDLSTFFSALNAVSTDPATTNTATEPLPRDVSAVFRLLANNYQIVLGETEGVVREDGRAGDEAAEPSVGIPQGSAPGVEQHQQHLEEMIERLMDMAEAPPKTVQGMPDRWFDGTPPPSHIRDSS